MLERVNNVRSVSTNQNRGIEIGDIDWYKIIKIVIWEKRSRQDKHNCFTLLNWFEFFFLSKGK